MAKYRNKNKTVNRKLGKKGNVLDIFYLIVFVTVFGIISILSYTILTEMKPSLDAHATNDVSRNVTENATRAVASFDYILILIIVGMFIATVIGAYFIDSHPVFFVASLLLLILLMVLVPVFSNVFDRFKANAAVSTAAAEFTVTTAFMDKLPMYFFIMCCVVLIALYAKHRGGGGAI